MKLTRNIRFSLTEHLALHSAGIYKILLLKQMAGYIQCVENETSYILVTFYHQTPNYH